VCVEIHSEMQYTLERGQFILRQEAIAIFVDQCISTYFILFAVIRRKFNKAIPVTGLGGP
jgi:hypothetical protein